MKQKIIFHFFLFLRCFCSFKMPVFLYLSCGNKLTALMKYLLAFLGTLALLLGVIGIFLPVLPTTPFLLLSAALYLRSSRRLYCWLMSHRRLGSYIKNFQVNKSIPLRVKVVSVSMVWITLLYCAVFVAVQWWMSVIFIAIAIGVSAHILHYKTMK